MIEYSTIIIKGFIIGFSLATVLGPVSLFCIQQALTYGFLAGMAAGLGAATADGIFGAIAGFGLAYVCTIIERFQEIFHIISSFFLIYLGIVHFRRKEIPPSIISNTHSLVHLYTTTLFLTLSNPITIIFFTALLSGLGVGTETCNTSLAIVLFSTIFLGSLAWWFILIGGITALRKRISLAIINRLNKIASLALIIFGLLLLLKAVIKIG